ncbi:MAG: sigma 54-interacting transcriptional regulator, partial [Steroidobacteraceae bacterium]
VDEGPNIPRAIFYREFARDFERWLRIDGIALSTGIEAPHVLAVFFQIRRAFHYVFRSIFGSSLVIARLRAAAWQSVFTHDLRRYRGGLYRQMQDIPTLISGASGTGKDLVAQAIGMSRYLPFDPASRRFAAAFGSHYHPLSLSALAPNVIESELFGHRRGAFTGALDDRQGFLEECGEHGTVFLDEIGDLEPAIQVKLLRVLQSRVFQRIGETAPRRFPGKIVAATNKDLDAEMRAGRFRDDLYYRLCADRIETPTLRERISDDPEELTLLVRLLSRRIAGSDGAHAVANDVLTFIEQELGNDYGWPGNVRELEQCIRNVMVRRTYRPQRTKHKGSLPDLDRALEASELDAEKLVDRYCTLIYAKTGSFVETGRRLGIDRRTVRQRLDQG